MESRNILVVGASGHGKSNIVRAIATQTIDRGDRTVIHCNKGDVTRSFDLDDVVLISPAHRDGWAWDIGADLDGPAAAAEFSPTSSHPPTSRSGRILHASCTR
jgi:NAD(P)-dependent dehydrogenase (short-subunit alcohol dehydrogenase family)